MELFECLSDSKESSDNHLFQNFLNRAIFQYFSFLYFFSLLTFKRTRAGMSQSIQDLFDILDDVITHMQMVRDTRDYDGLTDLMREYETTIRE